MPLLNGKPLELHNYTKRLADDEEVFYCDITNEIFETYEEFCDRIITCNCMVWSCAITGKSGLTYQEALQSEEQALKNIKDFAPELRTPVLYLASLTNRTYFSEMADDVFNFVRERYFIGESVQVCFEENIWAYGQVQSVILPTAEEILEYCEANKLNHPVRYRPYPANLYKYEVLELLDDVEDDNEVQIFRRMVLTPNRIRRIKSLYTKDKNRAYLKQFTEQKKTGQWIVKPAIMDKYSISTLQYCDLFAGEPPEFVTKKRTSTKSNSKNGRLSQVSMKSFVVVKGSPDKSGFKVSKSAEKGKGVKNHLKSTSNKMHKKQEAASHNEEKEKEELAKKLLKDKEKEEKRREKERLANFTKEWMKKREDLECEDLKELPSACPIDCLVPNNLFGDFVMILEFFSCFCNVLNVKDYFPYGLNFDLLQRALTQAEIAGPFSNVLQLLLTAVFEFQDQEDDEVKSRCTSDDISLNENADLSVGDAVKLATLAAKWSRTHLNAPLNKLQLDAFSVTDILRLHLLSSGGRAGELSAKWRLQERGGYMSTDDPGLRFRLNEPEIMRFLAVGCVASLPIVDKVKIVTCLMNQILTYASVRDVIDERYEKVSTGKKDLKNDSKKDREKIREERKKEKEEAKETVAPADKAVDNDRSHKERQNEKKKVEYQRRWRELQEAIMGFQLLPLGRDRGYRRFWIFTSLPGLFIEDDEQWPGHCLSNPTNVMKTTISIDEDDTMTYIRKLFEAGRSSTGSDKENEGDVIQTIGSPKKKHFGEMNGVSLPSPSPSDQPSPVKSEENRLLMCTANNSTCTIHNRCIDRTKWYFLYREEELNELIKALNKRGYRESDLRQSLIAEKERILQHFNKCPVQKLNRFVPLIQDIASNKVICTRSAKGYENANLNFPEGTPVETILEMYLRELILDTENKICSGGLGSLKVKDRQAWRAALENLSYEAQDSDLSWPTKMVSKHLKDEEDEQSRPESPCSVHSSSENDESGRPEQTPTVKNLAMAVLQVARSVLPKFLKKPLFYEEKKTARLTVIERWELSLMQSTSFSQIYLHLSTLESSVQWSKSVVYAKCKVCRRGSDDANMLLCDSCDCGFHLYCLKPKLTSIPRNEWFCPNCRPKEKAPIVRKARRRLLEDEDDDDDEPLIKKRGGEKRKREETLDDLRTKRGRYP